VAPADRSGSLGRSLDDHIAPSKRASGPRSVVFHAPAFASLALFTFILLRSYLGNGIPAGTDTLGFIARARESSQGGLGSAWAPAGFGAPRTFTLEQLLGVLTLASRNAYVTYKLVTFALTFTAAASAYFLSWRLTGNRRVSALAGILYASSPIVLAQWASGHLNVEVAIALLPAQLLLWIQALEGFRLKRALWLGVLFGLLLLDRPDMVVLSAATLTVYFGLRVLAWRDLRIVVRRAALTVAVASAAALALDSYQIVPALAGVRASWLSSKSLFDVSQLVDHSVRAYQSLAGFAQETGYFGYSGLPTSFAHPWIPYASYAVVALLVPLLALAVFARRRSALVARILCLGLLADFVAKGTRPPLGGVYSLALKSFHPLTNFRDPNRWLVVQALCFALLASAGAALVVRSLADHTRLRIHGRATRWTAFVVLGGLLSVPSLPVVAAGLSTYRVTGGQHALLDALRNQKGDFIASSVPYGSAYRYVTSGSYQGYEHDLGSESALFTDKPAVGSGDWGARGQAFVEYTHQLLTRRDPAFVRLLGANNVGYLLAFNYPAVAERYTTNGSGGPNLAAGPLDDRKAVSQMPGLRAIVSNRDGALLAVASPSAVLTARPNIATMLGGASGLAAFADTPGIDVAQWAPITAGDLLDRGGLRELARVMLASQVVYMADTSVPDLALAAAVPLARIGGQLAGDARTLGGEGLAKTGQLVTAADDDSATRPASSSATFRSAPGQGTEIWARARLSPTPARIVVTIDGRAFGSVLPLSVASAGFAWLRVWAGKLPAGNHRATVTAPPSDFGSSANITQSVVVSTASREVAERQVRGLLARAASKLRYSSDPAIEATSVLPAQVFQGSSVVRFPDGALWNVDDPQRTQRQAEQDSRRGTVTGIASTGDRRFFTVAHHTFNGSEDWSRFGYVLVDFYGEASNARFEVNVFDSDTGGRVSRAFVDDRRGWRTLAIRINQDVSGGDFAWSRIGSVSLATETKNSKISARLGDVRLTSDPATERVNLEVASAVPGGAISLKSVSGSDCGAVKVASNAGGSTVTTVLRVDVPAVAVSSHCRVLAGARGTIAPARVEPVHFVRNGRTAYRVTFSLARTSVIDFSRSFDDGWKLSVTHSEALDHLPIFALVNGYVLPAGTYTATLKFSGDRVVPYGAALSVAAALLLFVLLLVLASPPDALAVEPQTEPMRPKGRRAARRERRRRALTRGPLWVLSGLLLAIAPLAAFRSVRLVEVVIFASVLVAPLHWKTYWTIALIALGEVAAAVVLRRYGGADLYTVVVVLSVIRATVPMLRARKSDEAVEVLDFVSLEPGGDVTAVGSGLPPDA
jgi:hypothetical protein